MIEYTFKKCDGKHPIITAVFSDSSFDILNSFLLSETRSFGKEIQKGLSDVLNKKNDTYLFGGNIFSFEANCESTVISDDISEYEQDLTIKTDDFFKLISSYISELKKEKIYNTA